MKKFTVTCINGVSSLNCSDGTSISVPGVDMIADMLASGMTQQESDARMKMFNDLLSDEKEMAKFVKYLTYKHGSH